MKYLGECIIPGGRNNFGSRRRVTGGNRWWRAFGKTVDPATVGENPGLTTGWSLEPNSRGTRCVELVVKR